MVLGLLRRDILWKPGPPALCPCHGAHAIPASEPRTACLAPLSASQVTTRGAFPSPFVLFPFLTPPSLLSQQPCVGWLHLPALSAVSLLHRNGASGEWGSSCSLLNPRTRQRLEPTEHIRNKETNNVHFLPLLSGNSIQPVPWLSCPLTTHPVHQKLRPRVNPEPTFLPCHPPGKHHIYLLLQIPKM